MVLPYLKILKKFESFSPSKLNGMIHECLDASRRNPCYLEVHDDTRQCFLFFRERQIYSAGQFQSGQFKEILIKDFFVAANQMMPSHATCYVVNSKLLHSILILFQKKPSLKLLTSMVDLDEVLDKIESDGKSCIVTATQDSFLAILRYEKGEVKALGHRLSLPTPQEKDFREDFLVNIYTLSVERPLEITTYEDLLVKYAADAKTIDEGYDGDIIDIYHSKPPIVKLLFKNKEIGHWVLSKPVFNIGRTGDNDIAIDNLAVSRLHAVLEKDKGNYYVRDCDSLNGTMLNGKAIGRAKLRGGDEIVIGKHTLVFGEQVGSETPVTVQADNLDQTVIIGPSHVAPQPPARTDSNSNEVKAPQLVERTQSGNRVFNFEKASLILGKGDRADVSLDGLFVADVHAEIVEEDGNFVLRHLRGFRRISVGGKPVRERVLEDNDEITIGNREFVFHGKNK